MGSAAGERMKVWERLVSVGAAMSEIGNLMVFVFEKNLEMFGFEEKHQFCSESVLGVKGKDHRITNLFVSACLPGDNRSMVLLDNQLALMAHHCGLGAGLLAGHPVFPMFQHDAVSACGMGSVPWSAVKPPLVRWSPGQFFTFLFSE